jgi:hypothetical protein
MIPAARVLAATGDGGAARPHVRGAVQVEALVRPLVHLPSVLEDIQKRVEATRSTTQSAKEQ